MKIQINEDFDDAFEDFLRMEARRRSFTTKSCGTQK